MHCDESSVPARCPGRRRDCKGLRGGNPGDRGNNDDMKWQRAWVVMVVSALLARARLECADVKPLPTVDGPEAKDLIEKFKGTLAYPKAVGGIIALGLPGLES